MLSLIHTFPCFSFPLLYRVVHPILANSVDTFFRRKNLSKSSFFLFFIVFYLEWFLYKREKNVEKTRKQRNTNMKIGNEELCESGFRKLASVLMYCRGNTLWKRQIWGCERNHIFDFIHLCVLISAISARAIDTFNCIFLNFSIFITNFCLFSSDFCFLLILYFIRAGSQLKENFIGKPVSLMCSTRRWCVCSLCAASLIVYANTSSWCLAYKRGN